MRKFESSDLGLIRASAIFTPADFSGNVTKQLVDGQAGHICWPVQVVFATTDDANPAYGATKPQLVVKTSDLAWTWVTWNVSNVTVGAADDWPNTIRGAGLSITAAANDLTTWTTGYVEVFVTARRERWEEGL